MAGIAILTALMSTKNFYMASVRQLLQLLPPWTSSAVSVQSAQIFLFLFLGSVALGTYFGGPIGDRYRTQADFLALDRRRPAARPALPFVNLIGQCPGGPDRHRHGLGLPGIVVYAQELLPGRVGMIAGLFFGFAFGMGGIGAVAIGWLADLRGIQFAFQLCAILPAIGLLVAFLPELDEPTAQPMATPGSGGRP